MPTAVVRVTKSTREVLRELAAKTGEPMQTILERAIEEYRRRRFLEETNAAYAALQQDKAEWERFQQEQAEWDVTLLDGLEPNEQWNARRLPTDQTQPNG